MSEDNNESKGLLLLKKGQKGLVHALFSRLGLFVLMLLLEVALLVTMFQALGRFLPLFYGGTTIFVVIMVVYLLNTEIDPTAKITWLVFIMLFHVFGAMLFWFTQSEVGHRALKFRIEELIRMSKDTLGQEPSAFDSLHKENPGAASLINYINRNGCHPVYDDTQVTYFPNGQAKWEELLRQLEKAEKYVFLEYFIIDEGLMWGKVLELLARKAKEGVDVRVLYDGTNEFSTLPHSYQKQLRDLGIQCKVFSPLAPIVSTHYNYRDHRKIFVIDGKVAFNGGINLADEYIGRVKRFGEWKDTAVMLTGNAVRSFTLMFLQMWCFDDKHADFQSFLEPVRPWTDAVEGFVAPFGDCPLDADKVGERVYMDILNRAQKYVHIMTPYLILDSETETALKFAAERGVEVSLILPGIPDKKIPYALAKTHYASLLASGVKIYEYEPGFVHAKVFVSDDREAVVGTINLDYRSLYHHFECATWMYGVPCVAQIEQDFQDTCKDCRQVTAKTIWKGYRRWKLIGNMMKVLAPLL
ncbi:MAG: cardiolipin synthase [Acetatifactor sp.]|nr:cardiolipin synthase [Acetatifactor sp.]